MNEEKTLATAAAKAGMDEKTARKWLKLGRSPSEVKTDHNRRTRKDSFEEVWPELEDFLKNNSGLEAKTLFEYLQRKYLGRFADGQIRTLQRRIKIWRALEGEPKEVYFPQEHTPGKLSQSDFTHMSTLNVSIAGIPFPHMIYHFVLTYSNWEAGSICFSESFESLSDGLQNALFKLGGVPKEHQTDSLSAAVNNLDEKKEFTQRYQGLLNHYGIIGKKTQAESPNENGDVEQRHNRFKKALDQALMLRGCRDFENSAAYESFLEKLFKQLNAGRMDRLEEEIVRLHRLPKTRLDACKRIKAKASKASTVRVQNNTYSVNSRLIGESVEAKVYAEHIDIYYGGKKVENMPRLNGKNKHHINYRHIIDWLVRKPGAFENYRYRSDLFPSSTFRIAYDILKKQSPTRYDKEYLRILKLAAYDGESSVESALKTLIGAQVPLTECAVKEMLAAENSNNSHADVNIPAVDLLTYDHLLEAVIVK
jgi:transposase